MESFFGAITPALLVAIITAIVQWAKIRFLLSELIAEVMSLGLSYIILGAYHVIVTLQTAPPQSGIDIAWLVFQTAIYPILGWFMVQGIYYKIVRPLQASNWREMILARRRGG
jgi:hypothetical protein